MLLDNSSVASVECLDYKLFRTQIELVSLVSVLILLLILLALLSVSTILFIIGLLVYVLLPCSTLHLLFVPFLLTVLAPILQTLLDTTVCMALVIVSLIHLITLLLVI